MAVSNVSFAAQVNDWVKESKARMTAVFRESCQDVTDAMQKPVGAGGNMPVDTGFLRASLQTGTTGPIPLDKKPAEEGAPTYSYNPQAAALTIAGLQPGDTYYATYGAVYAARVHYGFQGQDSLGRSYDVKGRFWVDLAAQQWQAIVTANVERLQSMSGGKPGGQ